MEKYSFKYNVRLDDLDYMGIVGNSNWLVFLERARIELLDAIHFPFSKMMEKKIGGVVSEAHYKFLKPAFFNDQLTVEITPHSPFKKGLILKYTAKNQKDSVCLEADVTMVFVDHQGSATNMPEEIGNIFVV